MSLLAASLCLGSLVGGFQSGLETGAQGVFPLRQRSETRSPQYLKLLPSLATLVSQGTVMGTAVLIDRSGLYLASKDSVVSREGEAIFENNLRGHVSVVSEDRWTQLVLLRSDYVPPGATPVTSAGETPVGTGLIVVLRSGVVSAQIVSDSRLGVNKVSNRAVPLSELRLELPEASLGNTPVFTDSGEFVGILNVTLTTHPSSRGSGVLGNHTVLNSRGREEYRRVEQMGPANLAVAYLPSPEALKLVLDGFCSPSHVVEHATLGVFCTDGAGGALVHEVMPDSPAEQSGIRDGDMITAMGSYFVRNSSDFAKTLFKYRPGNHIRIRLDRGGRLELKDVVLGKSSD